MLKYLGLALGALSLSFTVHAEELNISFGDESLRAEYIAPLGQKVADNVATTDIGVMYNEADGLDRVLAHAGLMIYGDTGARKANVQAGLGARAIFIDVDLDLSGFGIALGGTVSGRVPDFNRLGGQAWFYYAPDVSAFSDLDGYSEYGVSIDYQLIRQASIMLGYRRLRADFGGPSKFDAEKGGFLGMRFVF